MHFPSRVGVWLAFIVVTALLSACAVIPVTPTIAPTARTSFTVEDALGRTVTFETPPQRIVIAGKANFMLNDAVYLFPQAQTRVVALTEAGQRQAFVALIEPRAAEKLRFAPDVGAEEIAAADPDLVLLKSFMADQMGKPLEALGIPVVYLDLETPEQYRRDLRVLGVIFQDEARAEEIIAFYDERLERIRERLTAEAPARPTALVLQYDGRGEDVALKAPPASWIQTWMLEFAGATPIWQSEAGGWTVVNLEQIAVWDPEHVFVINYFGNVEEAAQSIRDAPLWQPLTAVQEGHVYAFPKDYYSWDQPDTRWILGVTWMAKQLHPELFTDVEMTEEIHRFYESLYGLRAETVEDEILPLIQGDLR
ncbi:MAG: ABC transporter substrate-binding protein [Anaerolineae bacterium]